jgi:hypothetical protein
MRCWCLIREQVHYRREAFLAGIAAAGLGFTRGEPAGSEARRGDVLILWNRYAHWERMADAFERAGGRVIVAENGYLGNDGNGKQHYALALSQHNGGGTWPADDGARWRALGVELQPWRGRGHHVLVCPQRGIGPKHYAQHPDWARDVAARLQRVTRRPVRIRPHPGNQPPVVPLEKDLAGCWAVVTWASNAGTHALIAGIPVFYEAPHWILAAAGQRDLSRVDDPLLTDRRPAFERLACAQWTLAEIASGEPFRRLLDAAAVPA